MASKIDENPVGRREAIERAAFRYQQVWLKGEQHKLKAQDPVKDLPDHELWVLSLSQNDLEKLIDYSIPAKITSVPEWTVPLIAWAYLDWSNPEKPRAKAVDAVQLRVFDGEVYVLAIERIDTGRLAVPGGFMDHPCLNKEALAIVQQLSRDEVREQGRQRPMSESPQAAAGRETKEETGLETNLTPNNGERIPGMDTYVALTERTKEDRDPRGIINSQPSLYLSMSGVRHHVEGLDDAKPNRTRWMPAQNFLNHEGEVWADTREVVAEAIGKAAKIIDNVLLNPRMRAYHSRAVEMQAAFRAPTLQQAVQAIQIDGPPQALSA